MKYFVWFLSAVNVLTAARFLFGDSNYAVGSTILFVLVLLAAGCGGFYVSHYLARPGWGLLINLLPWGIVVVAVCFSLMTGGGQGRWN